MTKHRYSRREFMGLSGAGLAGLIGAVASCIDSAADNPSDPISRLSAEAHGSILSRGRRPR